MKHMETITYPPVTRLCVHYITCDICGVKIAGGIYDVDEIEVRHRAGYQYPECGGGTETTFDLCGECFDEKLVPWLRSQGAEPHVEEWET